MPYPKNQSKLDFPYKVLPTKICSGNMAAGINGDLRNYPRRLEKNKQALAEMKNGQVALAFLDHLHVLGPF